MFFSIYLMCNLLNCTDSSKVGVLTVHVSRLYTDTSCCQKTLQSWYQRIDWWQKWSGEVLGSSNHKDGFITWYMDQVWQYNVGWSHYVCSCLLRTSHHLVQKTITINKVFIIDFSMRTNSQCFSAYYINLKIFVILSFVCVKVCNVQLK